MPEPRHDGDGLRAQGRRRGHDQLPARRVRLPRAPGADARVGTQARRATTACSTRWPRCAGCATTSRPSAATRQRDDLRRVGGIVRGERAHGLAARGGTLPPGHRRERRLLHGRNRERWRSLPLAVTEQEGAEVRRRPSAPNRSRRCAPSPPTRCSTPRARRSRASRRTSTATSCPKDVYTVLRRRPADARCRSSPAGTPTRSAPASSSASRSRPRRASRSDTRKRFGTHADAILKAYPAATDAEALESAAALASDLFIGHATWKWIEMHSRTGGAPVYRYSFDRKIPVAPDGHRSTACPRPSRDIGARHAGEIEYVFGTLDSIRGVPGRRAIGGCRTR